MHVDQTQTLGPPVFHMPLPIGVDYPSGDTILTLTITQAPQGFQFVLPQEPMVITVDPETWVIQRNTVTYSVEEMTPREIVIERITTIGRAIELKLTAPCHVKVFDITGRKIHEAHADELKFKPSSAGIYHVMVGDEKQRVVIVK